MRESLQTTMGRWPRTNNNKKQMPPERIGGGANIH